MGVSFIESRREKFKRETYAVSVNSRGLCLTMYVLKGVRIVKVVVY